MGSQFRVDNRVSPLIDDDEDEGSQDGSQEQDHANGKTKLFVLCIGVVDEWGDDEQLEVHSQIPSPTEAIVLTRWPMVSKIINEEHVPEDTSVVAGSCDLGEEWPNGAIHCQWCNFPEEKDSHHVGWPDSDKSM